MLTQVRKIGPTRRSVSGVYMFRGVEALEFESTLERDFLIRKEFSLSVLGIVPQPCQIPVKDPKTGKRYTYTPDYAVYYRLGAHHYDSYPKPELIEVKPEQEWRKHWRQWLTKWKAARRYARQQGMVFHVMDESRIRDDALKNILFLRRYQGMSFSPEESGRVIETVREMGTSTLDYLLARHFMGMYRAEGIAHLWYLIAVRKLDCDIACPLGTNTEVWVPHDG